MKRMLMLATTAAMIEQFNKNNILILESMGYEVHVIGNWMEGNPISDEQLEQFKVWLTMHHGKWFHMPATRRPADVKNNAAALKQVIHLINKYHYEFIHCHTPIGSIIGRLAAVKTHTKIIYTAHGFHFFKGAPVKNWLLYYPAEWVCSWITDILITINKEDYERAKKHLHAKRVEYIPGVGIEVEKFAACYVDKKEKCRELGIPDDKFILLSVGELQERKNQKIVIDALGQMQSKNIYYLIAGKGALKQEYERLIKSYNMQEYIKLLDYRTDIDELCEIADCFIHTAFQEGLSVALLEAMASGLPVIGSDVRGVRDLVVHGKGGICVRPKSLAEVKNAIQRMYSDKSFRDSCGYSNMEEVKQYCIENVERIIHDKYRKFVRGGGRHLNELIQRHDMRKALGFCDADFIIISVGELNSNKNHEVIIKALSKIEDQTVKYIICGQGELKEYLEQLIAERNMQKRVKLLGYRRDIRKLLLTADVFAFPSKREGLSVSLMEAMAGRLPVVCGNIRGNKDLIDNNCGGCLVDKNSADEYVAAIKKFIDENMLKKEMGKWNRKKVKDFSQCRVNESMKRLYETI